VEEDEGEEKEEEPWHNMHSRVPPGKPVGDEANKLGELLAVHCFHRQPVTLEVLLMCIWYQSNCALAS